MRKKGVMSLPFGMIFSIIIIIAVIGVSFYAITYFLGLSNASSIGIFYKDFQDKVNTIWNAESASDTFSGNLPGGIESVCIGDLGSASGKEYDNLKGFRGREANVFLYPYERAEGLEYKNIEHLDISEIGWHCFPVQDGDVRIKLEKGSFDSLVKVVR